jgi:hypothetical protein
VSALTGYVRVYPSALLTVIDVLLTAVTSPFWVATVLCPQRWSFHRHRWTWHGPRTALEKHWQSVGCLA